MRRHRPCNGIFQALLLALTVSVAAAAQADDPALQGTFVNEQQSTTTIETAIETAVAKMNFIKRPIARSRLKKTNEAHRRVEIEIGGGQISVAFDGRKPVQMPADGSTIRWTREDGETFDVHAAWDGERLVETFKAEDGTRANAFSVSADGQLTLQVTLTSPQLDRPLVYALTFSRAAQ
jgi:RNase P/RNase MRP subunit p29